MTKTETKDAIEKITNQLLKKIGLEKIKVDISQEKELFKIDLKADKEEEQGMLIGYHGETISSLQLLLSLFIYKKTGEWTKILVDVGDYRTKREEQLKELALKAAQRVKFSGRSVSLSGLSSFERRAVHMFLKEDPEIETHSEGEGKWRMLVVSPVIVEKKKAKEN